ncbi:MAG: TatD family hydrolase [Clostridiales bacterium]|nr:TatD family hydrolase [Clostridiales bacterium]
MNNIFDSHAHYDDEAFDADRDELLSSLPEKGISNVINCGCELRSCKTSLSLAEKYPFIYAACGVHPQNCAEDVPLSELYDTYMPFWKDDRCVAVGEIGLDYHYDFSPKDMQISFFEAQVKIAVELQLPVIVHDREAHADSLAVLKKYRPSGVMHCFSGSVEMAQEILKLGMYIGLGGAVTFKNAKKPLEVAAAVPADRLLLETDCPYMTPVPFRGKRNDSSFIPYAAEKIAEVRNVTAQEILDITDKNARELFKLQ